MKQVKDFVLSAKVKDSLAKMASVSMLLFGCHKFGTSEPYEIELNIEDCPDMSVALSVSSTTIARSGNTLLWENTENPAEQDILESFDFVRQTMSEDDVNLIKVTMLCQHNISKDKESGMVKVQVAVGDIRLFEED